MERRCFLTKVAKDTLTNFGLFTCVIIITASIKHGFSISLSLEHTVNALTGILLSLLFLPAALTNSQVKKYLVILISSLLTILVSVYVAKILGDSAYPWVIVFLFSANLADMRRTSKARWQSAALQHELKSAL